MFSKPYMHMGYLYVMYKIAKCVVRVKDEQNGKACDREALLTSAERYLAVMLKLGPDLLTCQDRGGGRPDNTNGCLLRTAERVRPGLQLSSRKNVIAGIETGSLFSDLNIGGEGGRWSAKLANRSRAPLSTWSTRSQVSSETRAKYHR